MLKTENDHIAITSEEAKHLIWMATQGLPIWQPEQEAALKRVAALVDAAAPEGDFSYLNRVQSSGFYNRMATRLS